MSTLTLHTAETLIPNTQEAEIARQSSKILARHLASDTKQPVQVTLQASLGSPAIITLPASTLRLLLNILIQIADGNAVALVPIHAELTSQEAANLLNVSRPYLIQLLEAGQIPCRKVGTRHRILFQDLLHYKQKIDAQRLKVLEQLTEQAQLLNLGY